MSVETCPHCKQPFVRSESTVSMVEAVGREPVWCPHESCGEVACEETTTGFWNTRSLTLQEYRIWLADL